MFTAAALAARMGTGCRGCVPGNHGIITLEIRPRQVMGKRGRDHSVLSPFVIVRRPCSSSSATPAATRSTSSARPASSSRLMSSASPPPSSSAAATVLASLATPSSRAPVVRHTARARPSVGALGGEDRSRLLDALFADFRAQSAQGPHASLLRTWARLHRRWFGDDSPHVPITPMSIYAVAAQMKEDGYRRFPNYSSAAKDLHITCGHPWPEVLAAAASHATASTQRGIGPAHQCSELMIEDVRRSWDGSVDPLVAEGPADWFHMFVMSYFHVLRGMEIITANAADLVVDAVGLTESWQLSACKTDPQAIGCTRTWGCVCQPRGSTLCPVHSGLAHMAWLRTQFGDASGDLPPGLPLFPTMTGTRTTAERLTATVAAVADRLGLPPTDVMGRNSYTEHVFRVSGSRMLARAGVSLEVIMLMARWSSDVIRRYVGDVPLTSITSTFAGRASGVEQVVVPAAHPAMAAAPAPCGLAGRILELETHLHLIEADTHPQLIRNDRSGIVHSTGEHVLTSPPSSWRAPCGWRFGAPCALPTWLAEIGDVEPDLICPTCLPELRAQRSIDRACDALASAH